MTPPTREWVKLPSRWIETRGLTSFYWKDGEGSSNLSALMLLTVIAHQADAHTGTARATYDDLSTATELSRASVSAGLNQLYVHHIVERAPLGRSTYRLSNYDPEKGWAQFPARGLYMEGSETVSAFSDFRLRSPTELDAMKLYFLFASRRDRRSNMAHITYETIEKYSAVPRNRIRRALSLLAAEGLVSIEHHPRADDDYGNANAYRLSHLHPRRHMGTTGRLSLEEIFFD